MRLSQTRVARFTVGSSLVALLCASGVALAADTQTESSTQSGAMQSKSGHDSMKTGATRAMKFESVSLSFSPGSADLTEQDKTKLRDQLRTMSAQGKVSRAKIAVWSDQEHPQSGSLPKADQDLAQQRIKSVENYLKQQEGLSRVEAFNMAENRNWIGRMFHREQAELDAAFAKAGQAPVSNQEFNAIKSEGGASKAVVILEHKSSAKK